MESTLRKPISCLPTKSGSEKETYLLTLEDQPGSVWFKIIFFLIEGRRGGKEKRSVEKERLKGEERKRKKGEREGEGREGLEGGKEKGEKSNWQ